MIEYKKFEVTCEKITSTQEEIISWNNIKRVIIRSPDITNEFKKLIGDKIYNILNIKETEEILETTCFTWDPFIDWDEWCEDNFF